MRSRRSAPARKRIAKVSGERRPDFIILDVLMPEMNGLETLQADDADRPHAERDHAFVLERSGHGCGSHPLGAQDYLTKPFEKAELDAAMLKCRQKTAAASRKIRRCANTATRLPRT